MSSIFFEKIRNYFLPLILFVILVEAFLYFENEWLVGQIISISELTGLVIITVGLIILVGRYKIFFRIKLKTIKKSVSF